MLLFSFGVVSSREEIVERRRKKAADMEAAAAAAALKGANSQVTPEDQDREIIVPKPTEPPMVLSTEAASSECGIHKRPRGSEEAIRTYVPKWGVLTTDRVCYGVLEESKEVAPDLCRGLMLPADQSLYSAASPTEAVTELMTLLSLVIFLLLPSCQFKVVPLFCNSAPAFLLL